MDSAVDTASRCRIHAQHDATAGLAPTLALCAALACSHLTLNTIAKQDEGENRIVFVSLQKEGKSANSCTTREDNSSALHAPAPCGVCSCSCVWQPGLRLARITRSSLHFQGHPRRARQQRARSCESASCPQGQRARDWRRHGPARSACDARACWAWVLGWHGVD